MFSKTEAIPSPGENAVTPAQADRRRSTRTWHRAAVVVRATSPSGAPISVEGQTQVVNAHGGLMKIKAQLGVGQTIILMNAKPEMERVCRIVTVQADADGGSKIAFEFLRPSPKFWAIAHPPEDWSQVPD